MSLPAFVKDGRDTACRAELRLERMSVQNFQRAGSRVLILPSFTVPSALPLASIVPSGLKSTKYTNSECPVSVKMASSATPGTIGLCIMQLRLLCRELSSLSMTHDYMRLSSVAGSQAEDVLLLMDIASFYHL